MKDTNAKEGLCSVELMFSSMLAAFLLLIVIPFSMQSIENAFWIGDHLELMRMHRFIRQVVSEEIRFAQGPITIEREGKQLHIPKNTDWRFRWENYQLYKIISDGQRQPYTLPRQSVTGHKYRVFVDDMQPFHWHESCVCFRWIAAYCVANARKDVYETKVEIMPYTLYIQKHTTQREHDDTANKMATMSTRYDEDTP